MTFKIFVHPSLFEKVPAERKETLKSAIKGLTNPFPDSNGDKKELKGTRIITYRLRVGDYRVFYQIDEKEEKVYVFDILTLNRHIRNMEECELPKRSHYLFFSGLFNSLLIYQALDVLLPCK